MRNFQGIVFIWTRTYSEIFESAFSVPLKTFLFLIHFSGVQSWQKCSVQPLAPLFLIVQGGLSILVAFKLLTLFVCCNDGEKVTCSFKTWIFLLFTSTIALIVWHFIGAVWIFMKWQEFQRTFKCTYNAFVCSFVLLIFVMIEYGLAFIGSLCYIKQSKQQLGEEN